MCARLLREHAGESGRTERYTIYDQGDMRRVIHWLLSDAKCGDIQRALADYGEPASAEVLAEIRFTGVVSRDLRAAARRA